MAQYNRISWVSAATRGAALGKEYSDAWQELSDHIQDHTEALMAAGFSKEAAEEQAVTAMGDPQEVNRLLRKIHRPVLTRILQISKVLLCLAAALTLFTALRHKPWEVIECYRSQNMGMFGLERESLLAVPPPEEALYAEQTLYRRGGTAAKEAEVGNCTISVSRYAVSRVESEYYGEWLVALEVQFTPHHLWQPTPDIPGWFSLTDSNGNYRDEIRQDIPRDEEMYCSCLDVREGRSDVHILFAWLPEDCSWVDLTYTNPEHTATLRINVEGGTVYEAAAE